MFESGSGCTLSPKTIATARVSYLQTKIRHKANTHNKNKAFVVVHQVLGTVSRTNLSHHHVRSHELIHSVYWSVIHTV